MPLRSRRSRRTLRNYRRTLAYPAAVAVTLGAVTLGAPPAAADDPAGDVTPTATITAVGDPGQGTPALLVAVTVQGDTDSESTVSVDDLAVVSEPAGVTAAPVDGLSGFVTGTYGYLLTAPPGQYKVAVSVRGQAPGVATALTFGGQDEASALVLHTSSGRTVYTYGGTSYGSREVFRLAYYAADGSAVTGLADADLGGVKFALHATKPMTWMSYAPKEVAPGVYEAEVVQLITAADVVTGTFTLPGDRTVSLDFPATHEDRTCANTVVIVPYGGDHTVAPRALFTVYVRVVDGACQGVGGLDQAYFEERLGIGFEIVQFNAPAAEPGEYTLTLRGTVPGTFQVLPLFDTETVTVTGAADGAGVIETRPRWKSYPGGVAIVGVTAVDGTGAPVTDLTPADLTVVSHPAGITATPIEGMWGYGNGYFYLLTGPPGDYTVAVSVRGQGLGQAAGVTLDESGQGAAVLVTDNPHALSAVLFDNYSTNTRHLMRLAVFAADGTPVRDYVCEGDQRDLDGPWTTLTTYDVETTVEIAPGVYQTEYALHVYEPGTVTLTVTIPSGIKATETMYVEWVDRRCQSTVFSHHYFGLPVAIAVGQTSWVQVTVIDPACQGVAGLDEAHFRAQLGAGLTLVRLGSMSPPGAYQMLIRADSPGEHTIFPAYDDTKAVVTGGPMDVLAAMLRRILDLLRNLIERLIGLAG
jgi:hypothetical protein